MPDANAELSSSSENQDVTAGSSTATQDVTANSSTATNDASPASSVGSPETDREGLLAAVQNVVKVEPETPALQEPDKGETEAKVEGEGVDGKSPAAADATPDPTPEELAAYKPDTRKRIEKLVQDRKAAEKELETLRPVVEAHQQFTAYLQEHQLEQNDVNLLLGVGAALRRGDFKAFLDGVRPYVQLAEEALGDRLPDDLQKQVDDGYATPEVARELARTRFAAEHGQARLAQQEQQRTADAQAAAANAVRSGVQSWEESVRARDPDYSVKADAVRRYSLALVAEKGRPQTAEQAIALAEEALAEVNKTFAKVRPAVQPTKPQPGSVHVAASATAEPKSLMEAALLGLQKSRSS